MDAPVLLELDVASAICIISNIQLARRHPANNGQAGMLAERVARILQEKIGEKFPEVEHMLELGWDEKYDKAKVSLRDLF